MITNMTTAIAEQTLFSAAPYLNTSPRGLYGDTVEEIDASTGQVLKALKDEALDKNTLVIFTSDNGPWLTFGVNGGSAGLLRDGKGSTFEGGMREPFITWWPGRVPAGKTVGIIFCGGNLDSGVLQRILNREL